MWPQKTQAYEISTNKCQKFLAQGANKETKWEGSFLRKLNAVFWTVVLEKTLESPLDCKEIQPVHPKGNQSWIFIGKTDAEAETPIL